MPEWAGCSSYRWRKGDRCADGDPTMAPTTSGGPEGWGRVVRTSRVYDLLCDIMESMRRQPCAPLRLHRYRQLGDSSFDFIEMAMIQVPLLAGSHTVPSA